MGRLDYYDDPAAPPIISVVPSVTAVVPDDRARILLVHKTDKDLWALPGGGHDPGESITDTVVRLTELAVPEREAFEIALAAGVAADGRREVDHQHHQGLADLGVGAAVTARSLLDRLPEALEGPACPCALGVQWHPGATEPTHAVTEFVHAAARQRERVS